MNAANCDVARIIMAVVVKPGIDNGLSALICNVVRIVISVVDRYGI